LEFELVIWNNNKWYLSAGWWMFGKWVKSWEEFGEENEMEIKILVIILDFQFWKIWKTIFSCSGRIYYTN